MSALLKDPGVGLALARLSRERDRIIWPDREPIWACGIDGGRFSPEQMRELMARGFANGLERQNDGPTIDAALCFAESMPGVELRGYVVAFSRRDRRVTVDAVQWVGPPRRTHVRGPMNAVPHHVLAAFMNFASEWSGGSIGARRVQGGRRVVLHIWWD